MRKLMPVEYKIVNERWKPVYDEYRRINYRLKEYEQMNLFELAEQDEQDEKEN